MSSFIAILWVGALAYAVFLAVLLILGRGNLKDRRFLTHWMVAWSALLALTIGIRMAAAEPDQPPPSAPQLGTPMAVVTSAGGESEPETD
tara:strand:+ start:597 stop:866 length:270 start_codon:yes stop_codon:yes gene_type:complete